MAGFKRRADIQAGKTPEQEKANFEQIRMASKMMGRETTFDNLPVQVQEFVKKAEEARRCRTNLK